MAYIAKINDAYVRHYSDNGQNTAYVEWTDTRGRRGHTEGPAQDTDYRRRQWKIGRRHFWLGLHMSILFASAIRQGIEPRFETW